jgi:hypothetical protein
VRAAHFEIPTTLPSLANVREHHMERHKRNRKLRQDTAIVARALLSRKLREAIRGAGARIELCRIADRRLDTDNLAAALKPIRDGIADALELDDGSRLLTWVPEQEIGYPDRVRISIEVAP